LKRVDDAYLGFFRRIKAGAKPGFPRFRGKGRFNSFGFHEFRGIRLVQGRIRFKGIPGGLRVHFHRPLREGASIKCCVFRRSVYGWTVGLVVDAEARIRVARCHAATGRRRANHLHQASARLVRDYDAIALEKLNVKGLARSVLAKDVHDASWTKFISMLRYKAACAGAQLIEVDPYDTSQECSACGVRVPKDLNERLHACSRCGLTMDRDLNAARNILGRAGMGPGLRNVAEYGMRAGRSLDESARGWQVPFHSN
jgi:IS605 OrfB family transposase